MNGRSWGLIAALGVAAVLFVALGVWQVQRLQWKRALIAHTEAMIRAAPIDPMQLPAGSLADQTYRRLAIAGHFVPQSATLVTGTSGLGTGYWELVPLVGDDGQTIMINRGFLPEGSRIEPARRTIPTAHVRVEGLLRQTEPGGAFLRSNRPADDRWYSRDVAAIAQKRNVKVDPRLFIDETTENPPQTKEGDHAQSGGGGAPPDTTPTPGLTVIQFPNNHLGYALTWFTMALMAAGAAFMLNRRR